METNVAGSSESVTLADAVFGRVFNEALVHQVVTAHQASARAGTKKQKNRSEVSGGGKKPWRQKGTGRARAGTVRSPLWAGGGATFAARPRSFEQKVNRKMYRGAIRSIFSELYRQGRLAVVADLALDQRNTKAFIQALATREAFDADLIVATHVDNALFYSARNVAGVDVVAVAELDPARLAASRQVAITRSAQQAIEGWLA